MDVKLWTAEELAAGLRDTAAVLVDFYADWCGPCKRMAPVVERLAETFADRLTVAKVNVDEAPEAASLYGIQSIPALLLFQNGEVTAEYIGARSFEELEQALREQLA